MKSSGLSNNDRRRLSGRVAIVGAIPSVILSDPVLGPHWTAVLSEESRLPESIADPRQRAGLTASG